MDMISKDRPKSKYKTRDLVYLISSQISQLKTNSRKFKFIYVCLLVVYKIIDKFQYILIHTKGRILNCFFYFNRLEQFFKNSKITSQHTGRIETNNEYRDRNQCKNNTYLRINV